LITWVQADLGSVLHAAHDVEAEPGRERRGGVLAGRDERGVRTKEHVDGHHCGPPDAG